MRSLYSLCKFNHDADNELQMGQEDIGNHYFQIADYNNSFRAFSRMREYCTTSKQIAQMTFKLLHVCIFNNNWVVAHSYQQKVQTLQVGDEEKAKYDPVLAACVGLAHLRQDHYVDAANAFLSVNHSYIIPEPQAGICFQREVISPNDVAVYGGLSALATMNRATLQRRVLENATFRPILELEPHIRRAITMFCASKYTGCLNILESYMADYLVDLYLQDHFVRLYRLVRSKCIVQWCSAFSKVTWAEIENAFPSKLVDGSEIQLELESMILNGELDARIDLVDKVRLRMAPYSHWFTDFSPATCLTKTR
jgi:COP9 signalosome complex subunit 1